MSRGEACRPTTPLLAVPLLLLLMAHSSAVGSAGCAVQPHRCRHGAGLRGPAPLSRARCPAIHTPSRYIALTGMLPNSLPMPPRYIAVAGTLPSHTSAPALLLLLPLHRRLGHAALPYQRHSEHGAAPITLSLQRATPVNGLTPCREARIRPRHASKPTPNRSTRGPTSL